MKSLLENLGDYQILEKLGRGGMADVYLALDRQSNRRVALKLVEQGDGPEAREILDAERLGAELQQRISLVDPRVPQIYKFGELGGYFFIEMEFVEGSDLSALIASGPMKPEEAARIALELCNILRNVHDLSLQVEGRELRAVIHGDIKPKNIRMDTNGRVHVLDFGIAKGLSITRRLTSNVFGSVAYSSPERLESGHMDEQSDLWAVGVVLYEMLEGKHPFEATDAERLEKVIRSHASPRPLGDSCPAVLQQIVYKSLAHSPERRYLNAEGFESDLAAFLTGELTQAAQENEQTRRTIPEESEETRRTFGEESLLPVVELASPRHDRNRSFLKKLLAPLAPYRKWILAGGLIFLAGIGAWEGFADRAAIRLKSDIVAKRVDGEKAWNAYETIRHRSPLGFASFILKAPLQNLLRDNCERIFSEYLNSDMTRVREGDWIRCREDMLRAIQLYPNDEKSAAMMEYANGHILRINRKNMDAITAFQNATSLQPQWLDPYLGLARTYINNLGDMERGTQALKRAQQLGHRFGKRELAMMAEAARTRGLQDYENAKLMKDTDREKDYLQKAKGDLDEALKTYLQIAPYGNSTKQILSIQEVLGVVEKRMKEVNPPNPLLPWNWGK